MLPLAGRRKVPVILMHMQGTPQTMQLKPSYSDVSGEVGAFLLERLKAAESCGIDPADVLLDPGIGFGKTVEHNLTLLKRGDRDHALVGFYGHLAHGMTRDTFIGGEGSRFFHGDKHGRSFYLPPNTASNATFLTTLRYLLIHELSHTRHMNHSRAFWDCVGRFCPDYRQLDRQLLDGWRRVPSWLS